MSTTEGGRYSVAVACGFCGSEKAPQGIDSHERFCESNSVRGMTYSEAEARGLLDDDAEHASKAGSAPSDDADPDQRDEAPDALPERTELPGGNKPTREQTGTSDSANCPSCGRDELVESETARVEYVKDSANPDPDLLTLFNFCESYCEGCFALIGGKFESPTRLTELIE